MYQLHWTQEDKSRWSGCDSRGIEYAVGYDSVEGWFWLDCQEDSGVCGYASCAEAMAGADADYASRYASPAPMGKDEEENLSQEVLDEIYWCDKTHERMERVKGFID